MVDPSQNAWLAFIEMQSSGLYIAVQQTPPESLRDPISKEHSMTNFRVQTEQPSALNEFITEAFNAATIALVGVLGLVTLAATI
jgi:hypothetical protein